ncbi:chaperone DnaJ-domain superfamily protein [Klebsormidium nitens]|uniref:Chaperone DnaJ-domain superfamily protein n=1 Tax=Klebsormidium nitens TaxID=105231 RepID=A0A1Y1HMT2_KLENI|nr:chaperone DnaJ-domain superfamily protein [Klebsormidium nitens]|eukprot:GAQ79940.1 chaperone DnaJ-domain superfamily protein [Klebsormidium nitens]
MDYYRTLGIRRDATADEIKAAFRALALKFHPDRHATSDPAVKDKAGAQFKEVSEAYQVLSNDAKRAVYNREGRAGLHYGGAPGYQQYARYRGAHRSQYTGYQYDQSFRTRGFDTWWRAPLRGFGRTDYIFHASIALLGLGAFLFIDQAGESMWRRHNAGKSFEDLQAARQAQPQFAESKPSIETETVHRPARPPPHLLVRRPNPGWPFHHRRQRDVVAEPRKAGGTQEEAPRGTVGQEGGLKGGDGAGGGFRKPSEGGSLGTGSGPRLGAAATDSAISKRVSSSSPSVGTEGLSQRPARVGVVNKDGARGVGEQQGVATTSPSRGGAHRLAQPQTEGSQIFEKVA